MQTNIMTDVLQEIVKIQGDVHKVLEGFKGDMGYGKVKATEKDQREMFRNLTPQKLGELIREHGPDQVNEWLGKYMEEGY